jgi:hypothetical protein
MDGLSNHKLKQEIILTLYWTNQQKLNLPTTQQLNIADFLQFSHYKSLFLGDFRILSSLFENSVFQYQICT